MYILIIQARMGSTRLPGKVMKILKDKTILEWCLDRSMLSKKVDKIIVATSFNKENDIIENLCKKKGVECYRGQEIDVLDRYYQIAIKYPNHNIIRITSDCPLICPYMLDDMIYFYDNNDYDYIINHSDENYITPEGSSIEIFNYKTIKYLWENNKDLKLREHVTGYLFDIKDFDKYIKKEKYNYLPKKIFPSLVRVKISIDTEEDYNKTIKIVEHFTDDSFSYFDVLKFISTWK